MNIKPERLSDAVTLYEGDCLDVLPTLTGIDAVVTDPPYDEKTHVGARSCSDNGPRGGVVAIDFQSCGPELLRNTFSQCNPKGWLVSFADWRHALPLELDPPKGLEFVRMGIWTKLNPMPQLTGDRPSSGWECVLIFHPKGKKSWNGGSGPAVWNHGTSRYGYFGPSNHPTEKPLGLVRKLIQQFSNEGDTILDPFAGSGTTGVAAVLEGRKCILIERDPKYCDIIRRRIADAEATGPQSLFRNVRRPELFDSVEAEQCVA